MILRVGRVAEVGQDDIAVGHPLVGQNHGRIDAPLELVNRIKH